MNFARDFRYGLWTFRRGPSLSAIIILTLALCIGANTAIFSVIDATLLRPLPYPEPDRLVNVATFYRSNGREARLALVLAIVGIYGLMGLSVVERRRELGIRVALGSGRPRATPAKVRASRL